MSVQPHPLPTDPFDRRPDVFSTPDASTADALESLKRRPRLQWASDSRERRWLHLALFIATVGTTILAGSGFIYILLGTASPAIALKYASWPDGAWYSVTALAILGTHELGHYLTCRYYGVSASLPYFLPAPVPLTGTVGAFIRIRQPIRNKRVLFDVAAAGPIAGFVVAIAAVFIGVALSHIGPVPRQHVGPMLGEPLLFKAAVWLLLGNVPEGQTVFAHSVAYGSWFGLLATAINLFPFGQLDGGHISYAVLGRRSTWISLGTVVSAVILTWFSTAWLVWTALMMAMLFVFGPHHPRTDDEDEPLGRGRLALAVLSILIFVLCFTPSPIQL